MEAPDLRIAKMIAWVTERLDQPVSLRDVAKVICLSPGRTRHLFVQQTGLPFRTYLLWLRLTRAVELFGGGASLTEAAAHSAGFADSAHFSRTFRRMFGIVAAAAPRVVALSFKGRQCGGTRGGFSALHFSPFVQVSAGGGP